MRLDGIESSDIKDEPSWFDQSRQLSSAWLTSFGQAVLSLSRSNIASLFHIQAIVFGGFPGGFGPCSEFDALRFKLDASKTKIAPLDRVYSLITVGWLVQPVLPESPPEHGDATFVLYTTFPEYSPDGELKRKGNVSCIHAHFSRRAIAEKPRIIKGRVSDQ